MEAGHGTPKLDYKQQGHLHSAILNTTFILTLLPYMKAENSMVRLVVFGKTCNSAYIRGNFPSRGTTPSADDDTRFLYILLRICFTVNVHFYWFGQTRSEHALCARLCFLILKFETFFSSTMGWRRCADIYHFVHYNCCILFKFVIGPCPQKYWTSILVTSSLTSIFHVHINSAYLYTWNHNIAYFYEKVEERCDPQLQGILEVQRSELMTGFIFATNLYLISTAWSRETS